MSQRGGDNMRGRPGGNVMSRRQPQRFEEDDDDNQINTAGGQIGMMDDAVGNIKDEMSAMRQQLADLQGAAGGMTGNLQSEMQ